MALLLIIIFILGYLMIALEHPVKIDKAASALLTGALCWIILLVGLPSMPDFAHGLKRVPEDIPLFLNTQLMEHLANISSILFFLLAAMTIVELMDAHDAFKVITDKIPKTSFLTLLWVLSWVAFFLSAVLDNMTTAIVMCALARNLISDKETLWILGGFIIIAANAGGAFSPIGDVTTIMLWIGGQVTSVNIMTSVFLSSAVSLIVPLLLANFFFRNKGQLYFNAAKENEESQTLKTTPAERIVMFTLGAMALLSVPLFKFLTGYQPFLGILLAVSVLWYMTELLHRRKENAEDIRQDFSVGAMLHRIDTPSILFFLGILLAVGALEVSGYLHQTSAWLDQSFGNFYVINTIIGLLSAIVDNVPLVAAAMGMYDMAQYPSDHDFWKLLAFCAGTGGSILIIGSAAGVATMGILKIDFMWYLKKMSLFALLGYIAGVGVYYLIH